MESIILIMLGIVAIFIFFRFMPIWLSIAAIVGYVANFFAIYEHWNYTLSVGRLAELIGVIFPPVGILTGWIYIFN